MKDMAKKYLPYIIVIFAVYMIVPLIFLPTPMKRFSAIAYDFIFPITASVCSAIYCSKHGLDFLFSLIAPIIFLPSMLIYNNGFQSSNITTNLILLVVYLVAGIFGLFLGDLALGDERRKREQKEKAEAEEMLLEAKRRDEAVLEKLTGSSDDDDFDYDKYLSDIDKEPQGSSESEIDDILNEYHFGRK